MKYLILVLVMAGALACGPEAAPLETYEFCDGDLNGDGLVGLDDLNILQGRMGMVCAGGVLE